MITLESFAPENVCAAALADIMAYRAERDRLQEAALRDWHGALRAGLKGQLTCARTGINTVQDALSQYLDSFSIPGGEDTLPSLLMCCALGDPAAQISAQRLIDWVGEQHATAYAEERA